MAEPHAETGHGHSGRTSDQPASEVRETAGGGAGIEVPPTDVDFADPHAVREMPPEDDVRTAGSFAGRPGTETDTSTPTPTDEDWGFRRENRGMSTETKIGLALVLLLLATFGFVVWKKLEKQRSDAVASKYEEHLEEIEKRSPPKRRKAPGADPVAERKPREDAYGPDPGPRPIPTRDEFEFDRPERTADRRRTTDPPVTRDEFAFADDDGFAPPPEPRREVPAQREPAGNEFDDYEFADDLLRAERDKVRDAHDGRRTVEEPGRLEIVEVDEFGGFDEFDDPNVRPVGGREPGFDEFAFEDEPRRTNRRTPPAADDGWDDFEPIQRRDAKPMPTSAEECPLPTNDGWDNAGAGQFEPVGEPRRTAQGDGRTRVVSSTQADDCPIEVGPFPGAGGHTQTTEYPSHGQHPPFGGHPGLGGHGSPAPEGYPAGTRVHEVGVGDTYWTISRAQYGTAKYFNALAMYNESRIPDPRKMRPGMKVIVPPVEALHTRYPKLCGVVLAGGVQPAQPLPSGFFVGADGRPMYRVGDTDTLSDIAHAHLGRASRWVQIYELNRDRLPKPDTIRLGTVLVLPADASSVRLVRATSTTTSYR